MNKIRYICYILTLDRAVNQTRTCVNKRKQKRKLWPLWNNICRCLLVSWGSWSMRARERKRETACSHWKRRAGGSGRQDHWLSTHGQETEEGIFFYFIIFRWLCCIAMNNYTYIYMQNHNNDTIKTSDTVLRKIYLSFYWKGCVGEGVGDLTELQHINPNSIGHNWVSFPLWDMFSFQHLLSNSSDP